MEDKSAAKMAVNQDIFEAIITHTPNGIIVTDRTYNDIYINKSAEEITNFKEKDIIGKNLIKKFPQLKSNNHINEESLLNLKINGLNIKIKQFTVESEDVKIFLMIDTKESVELSENLKRTKGSNDELKEILDGSYDGVLVTDGEGNVLYVNHSYERITAIKVEEIMGKNMRELINPVWMPNSVAFVVMEERRAVSKKQVTQKGKNIIVTGMPIFDKKGNIKKVVINVRDITEIYSLREELLKSQVREQFYIQKNTDLINSQQNNDNHSVIAVSEAMKDVFSLANKVSNFQATVLIVGESGVGKEEVAKFIHNNSIKKDKPFITINCGAIPDNLLESELFGYEKGAFTGASSLGKEGLLETANGGTVFLDEIGEISLDFQVKILRVLETKQITRVGSVHPKDIDIRIIAATNRNIEEMVEQGTFREDLYYRLNVVQIKVPPLRQRKKDIGPLSMLFLSRFNQKYSQNKILTYDVTKELQAYHWPGNVRQLKNIIENMVVVSSNEYLQIDDLPWKSGGGGIIKKTIDLITDSDEITMDLAVEYLEKKLLEKTKQKYRTTREMAEHLGLNQSTVVRKLKKYSL